MSYHDMVLKVEYTLQKYKVYDILVLHNNL